MNPVPITMSNSAADCMDEQVVSQGAGTGGAIYYYHRNQQYSVTAITTSTGAVAERYAYTAYGQPTVLDASGSVPSTSSISNRYTYTGREWDATLALYHYRARLFHPLAGRFVSRDPIVYQGSPWNIYEYTNSRPLVGLDPTGLTLVTICENTCAALYPNWWQYAQYVGCISGCNQPLPPAPRPIVPLPPPPPPVTPPPGSGPPLSPGGYGLYCGPTRRPISCIKAPGGGYIPGPANSPPIDPLDAACLAHDCCLNGATEVISECFKPKCNPAFCTAMAAFNCGAYYSDAQMRYECQYMKWKAMGLFCPGPVPASNTL